MRRVDTCAMDARSLAWNVPIFRRFRARRHEGRCVCGMAADGGKKNNSPTVQNREAKFRYEILDRYECGVELHGTEVKSVREGKMSLKDSFCRVKNDELWMLNVHISPYQHASAFFNHEPVRERRLLLHKRNIVKLKQKTERQGMTLIATKAYFNERGWLKVEVALCRGKNVADKRETIKRRDQDREIQRVVKNIV